MSIFEKDLIRRLIQDFAQILARLAGLRKSGQWEQAESELAQTADKLLGPWARDAELLASDSLAKLLSAERITLYAELLAERAHQHVARGRGAEARADRRRALSLLEALEARALASESPAAVAQTAADDPKAAHAETSKRRRIMTELREELGI